MRMEEGEMAQLLPRARSIFSAVAAEICLCARIPILLPPASRRPRADVTLTLTSCQYKISYGQQDPRRTHIEY